MDTVVSLRSRIRSNRLRPLCCANRAPEGEVSIEDYGARIRGIQGSWYRRVHWYCGRRNFGHVATIGTSIAISEVGIGIIDPKPFVWASRTRGQGFDRRQGGGARYENQVSLQLSWSLSCDESGGALTTTSISPKRRSSGADIRV